MLRETIKGFRRRWKLSQNFNIQRIKLLNGINLAGKAATWKTTENNLWNETIKIWLCKKVPLSTSKLIKQTRIIRIRIRLTGISWMATIIWLSLVKLILKQARVLLRTIWKSHKSCIRRKCCITQRSLLVKTSF